MDININRYLRNAYNEKKNQFEPEMYTNLADNVYMDAESDRTVKDAVNEALSERVPNVSRNSDVDIIRNIGNFSCVNKTGVIKITFPKTVERNNFSISISGYNVTAHDVFNLRCGVHLSGESYFYAAAVLNSSSKTMSRVRFAYDEVTGKNCILLNSTDTYYGDIRLTIDQVLSVSKNISNEGWSIDVITDESGITNVTECPVSWNGDDGVWYDLTLQNGFAAVTSNSARYRKVGNMVNINAYIQGTPGQYANIAQLPVGFLPKTAVPFLLFSDIIAVAPVAGYIDIWGTLYCLKTLPVGMPFENSYWQLQVNFIAE